jgi:glycosyltransferase involved in cell wall biosynthesis
MVLLEAMAARTLVVASDIDGYRAAVGAAGVLVPPGDPLALAGALEAALAVPDGGTAIGGDDPRAVRRASASSRAEEWSMNHLAERYERLYWAAAVRPGR